MDRRRDGVGNGCVRGADARTREDISAKAEVIRFYAYDEQSETHAPADIEKSPQNF
ncbi:hypothetical protein DENSPDRAFT_831609 [Dentipellis sp. KUC8613]|nr:hypothetical protein DENSPDRAFT_831609 [Dentipellis sp. KUC8613]